jgi:hypothetical protein
MAKSVSAHREKTKKEEKKHTRVTQLHPHNIVLIFSDHKKIGQRESQKL